MRVVGVGDGIDGDDGHARFGEGAGLVDQDHIDPCQSFDGGKFSGEDAAPAEAGCSGGERQAGEQDEPFGDHG